MNKYLLGIISAFSLFIGGCASHQMGEAQAHQYNDLKDPIESVNRTLWDINYNVLDKYILRPTAVVYADYVPQFARTGLINLALNLEEPTYSVNNLLQGKLEESFISVGPF